MKLDSLNTRRTLVSALVISLIIVGIVASFFIFQIYRSQQTSIVDSFASGSLELSNSVGYDLKLNDFPAAQAAIKNSALVQKSEYVRLTLADSARSFVFNEQQYSRLGQQCPFSLEKQEVQYLNEIVGTLEYCYDRNKLFDARVFLWSFGFIVFSILVTTLIVYFWYRREQNFRKEVETEKQNALYALAQQVAHDIRSPLTALEVLVSDLRMIPEDTRDLLKGVSQRIQDIASDLLAKNRSATPRGDGHATSAELIPALVETLITEKRAQFRDRVSVELKSNLSPHELFAVVQPAEFTRSVSNLINNSYEAIDAAGVIELSVSGNASEVSIQLSDTGRGIPKALLPKLGKRGATFNKAGGSGLGFYYAKSKIESWGGTVTLSSTEGVGTRVTLSLPRVMPLN